MTALAFFGTENSFNLRHVGGTDSLVRRLAHALARDGDTVDVVLYGCGRTGQSNIADGVMQSEFISFEDAREHLRVTAKHVVSIYVARKDRPRYTQFRRKAKGLTFHHIYTTWNESYAKRSLLFAEARLWPFNGCLFCLSPRLFKEVSRWAPRASLLLPPVPKDYFQRLEDRRCGDKLRVAYAGRLDAPKGADIGIAALRQVASDGCCEARVFGFAWDHDAEGRQLHETLINDRDLDYIPVNQQDWAPNVDSELSENLCNTDIVLLPYRKLSSTIDVPLLLFEAMASLCAVVTPPLGDLHVLYGHSPFNLPEVWDHRALVRAIHNAKSHLHREQQRIVNQNASLRFDTASVAARFQREIYANA